MDRKQAKELIVSTFENSFDEDQFHKFIKYLLKEIEEKSFDLSGAFIPEPFRRYISSYKRIGKYYDGNHEIDILIVRLVRESSLERARTAQRNFVAWYLNGGRGGILRDAALVAFVSPNSEDWRFSLVKMDYRFDEKGRVRSEFTPARRWSYLVGKNEKSHTAQSRFIRFLEDDEHKPTLEELEEAFSVEKVTEEFFVQYRELLIKIKEELDHIVERNIKVREEFNKRKIDTVNFAKKLLGQIVFLYFLQKKGWLGVKKDGEWGTGSRHFLRELFEKKHGNYKNFFNDILEPLFYEALRTDRSHDDHYYSRFNCKIPFLDSELFDPINDYDWVGTEILLPNDLFSNQNRTKEGDKGDGILDIFDRYNFTVKEDEPLEKEVAIDPELLGKAYEKFNAIRQDNFEEYVRIVKSGNKGEEMKFNKEYGVYYTPREIVHYMCQQSLIYYLSSELKGKVSKEDIETFVIYGEQLAEREDVANLKKEKIDRGEQKETKYEHILPESIRKNAKLIDEKLAEVRICDPAVGSGAFPVGMMQEIVRLRMVLTRYIKDEKDRNPYRFKRECIEHSLYGVDLDPGAVEIAKLRMWLSLIVDEEDIHTIKPLPNLGYKVVPGDSLLGALEGWTTPTANKIAELQKEYVSETRPSRKRELKSKLDKLIEEWLGFWKGQLNYDVNFDFRLFFPEVFLNNNGFDIVIANPPYVRQERIKDIKPVLEKAFRDFYVSTADLYTYFYKKSYEILRKNGILCFISSNKWMRAKYGEKLRNFLKMKTELKEIIDFAGYKVFEQTVDTNIIIFAKKEPAEGHKFMFVSVPDNEKDEKDVIEFIRNNKQALEQEKLRNDAWILADTSVLDLKKKIEKMGKPLKEWKTVNIYFGIKTGLNDAFIIDMETRTKILANCRTEEEKRRTEAILKPVLRGRNIGKYYYKWTGLWLIKIESGWTNRNRGLRDANHFFKMTFPSVYNHLISFASTGSGARRKGLLNRDDQGDYWWELRDCDYYPAFEKEKIAWNRITDEVDFALVPPQYYLLDSTFFITAKEHIKYLIACLNSKVSRFWMKHSLARLGTGMYGARIYVENNPVPPVTPQNKQLVERIESLVEQILALTQSEDYEESAIKQKQVKELESEIDKLVYKLYDLTDEEIKIIEGGN